MVFNSQKFVILPAAQKNLIIKIILSQDHSLSCEHINTSFNDLQLSIYYLSIFIRKPNL